VPAPQAAAGGGRGDQPINPAGFFIHSQLHAARPDVIAAAHAHAVHGKAWSTLGRLLDPVTQDPCTFYGSNSLYADFNGVVLDQAEGKRIAVALGPNKAVILQNHRFLTIGASVEEAAWLFITADATAHAQLLAEAAGTPTLIRPEVAEPLGRPRAFGGFSFRPYYDEIIDGLAVAPKCAIGLTLAGPIAHLARWGRDSPLAQHQSALTPSARLGSLLPAQLRNLSYGGCYRS